MNRDAYTGGGGAGGARFALQAELFPSLLSSEGAFTGIEDSLVQENFLGASPRTPNFHFITRRPIY